ncbi:hypothetical protein DMN91_011168 [Ooceraea biroi]|uniref:Uncharacterized protein n=1 Tax=Ooceraea biroi TaxID=2015173 RepID=A0A3L8DB36_OOCBI|nr:hypothetical protein DMN91_011168 [Ooceraea biroi]
MLSDECQEHSNEEIQKFIENPATTENFPFPCHTQAVERTGYKYLEIGKCVPPTADAATVNIALGDTTCKEIMLTAKMWKGLVGSRTLICDNLARANSEHGSPPPVYLDDLAVRFATINGQPTIRLNTPSGQLTLPEPTVHYLLGLRHCVERAIVTMDASSGALNLNCVPSSTSPRV